MLIFLLRKLIILVRKLSTNLINILDRFTTAAMMSLLQAPVIRQLQLPLTRLFLLHFYLVLHDELCD